MDGGAPDVNQGISSQPTENSVPVEPVLTQGTLSAVAVKQKKLKVSNSSRAGLVYPVGRVRRLLKKKYAGPVTQTAAVYMSGVLEYLTKEVGDVAAEAASSAGVKTITARSIFMGIQSDNDLTRLYHSLGMVIPGGGVVPQMVLPAKKKKDLSGESIVA